MFDMRELSDRIASMVLSCRQVAIFRWLRTPIAVSLGLAGLWLVGLAQEQPINITSRTSTRRVERRDALAPSLRLDVSRVLIPVTVTDNSGRKVEGLRRDDFRIFQDGVQQTISEFSIDETPVSVGIVLDTSNSMLNKIDPARRALDSFLRMSLPGDEFFLITVQDRPELVCAFTSNVEEFDHEVQGVRTRGWTALFDGIYLGMNHVKRALRNQRALLVLSDGEDNNSRYTESEIKGLVRESDVRIFSVSVLGRAPSLEKLAQESGGRAFHIRKLNELSDLAASLSAVIHGEYLVGFSPSTANRDGKYHTIKVEVSQPADGTRLYSSWRHGYYAPVQ